MNRVIALLLCVLFAPLSHAWGVATGTVEVYYVNTYGNYSETDLNGGFCFKLVGSSDYFKVAYSDSGEKKNNLLLTQSIVLTAHMSGRQLKATYVDWGPVTSCRINGTFQPAKWLENLQLLN